MPQAGSGGIGSGEWGALIEQLMGSLGEVEGLERDKLEAQIRDAEEGRKNAMAIERLRSATSRYGVDAQTRVAMATLKQRAAEFEQTHALELKKFGLSYAQVATDYLSSPDRYAQGVDFFDMAGRVMGREGGPVPYGTNTTFQPKTQQEFAVLAGSAPEGQGAPQGKTATALGAPSPSPSPGIQQQMATAATGSPEAAATSQVPQTSNQDTLMASPAADPRSKALRALIDAVPPSRDAGMDANDFAVMRAAEALYSTNLPPGALQMMRPDQQKILGSFIRRSGRSLPDWLASQERMLPGQRSPRMAG